MDMVGGTETVGGTEGWNNQATGNSRINLRIIRLTMRKRRNMKKIETMFPMPESMILTHILRAQRWKISRVSLF